jgi:hypothetical protein
MPVVLPTINPQRKSFDAIQERTEKLRKALETAAGAGK